MALCGQASPPCTHNSLGLLATPDHGQENLMPRCRQSERRVQKSLLACIQKTSHQRRRQIHQMVTSQILKYFPKKQDCSIGFINIVNYASSLTLGQYVLYHHKIGYEIFTFYRASKS